MLLLKLEWQDVDRDHPGKEMFEKYYNHFLGSNKEGRGLLQEEEGPGGNIDEGRT